MRPHEAAEAWERIAQALRDAEAGLVVMGVPGVWYRDCEVLRRLRERAMVVALEIRGTIKGGQQDGTP